MAWEVEYSDAFGIWWATLDEGCQESVASAVTVLEDRGPGLGYPLSSAVHGSRHGHMRELRVQHAGDPVRILYAFDPRRAAILLIGGVKRGGHRWYERYVAIADRLYDEHLAQLSREGL